MPAATLPPPATAADRAAVGRFEARRTFESVLAWMAGLGPTALASKAKAAA